MSRLPPLELLRKLRRLSARELAELARAQFALLWAIVLVRTRPAGHLVSAPSPEGASTANAADAESTVRRLALAVDRAAENGVFRPTCLVKSVALHRMLEARGIRGSRIRVGVQMARSQFLAHAWVEYAGAVYGDRPDHVDRFTQLCDLTVVEPR